MGLRELRCETNTLAAKPIDQVISPFNLIATNKTTVHRDRLLACLLTFTHRLTREVCSLMGIEGKNLKCNLVQMLRILAFIFISITAALDG